jgi:SAM-dependent methyltransferase
MSEESFTNEEKFHDEWADSIDIEKIMVDESFEACTSPENRIILKWLSDLRDKQVLELGCGAGEASVYLAKAGARVTATDLSAGMLSVVNKLADKYNVEIETKQCSAENLPFNDSTFDIVYAANVLHHVDLETTINEVRRVLKKGGIFVSWDPLLHNPMIKLYRKRAAMVRTEDEHPLRFGQIKIFKKHFNSVQYETTWFFTLWIFIRFFIIEKADPNKERYWKKILIEHNRLESSYNKLERIDLKFLKILPFFKRY